MSVPRKQKYGRHLSITSPHKKAPAHPHYYPHGYRYSQQEEQKNGPLKLLVIKCVDLTLIMRKTATFKYCMPSKH